MVSKCKEVFKSFNYKRILVNTVEKEETFTHTLGVSSDIVQKEMYRFSDLSNNQLVLRPEGTAGVMRYVTNDEEILKTIEKNSTKLWYWGPMFRYERPQAGRMRQFYQIGLEKIGGQVNDPGTAIEGDFEAIYTANKCLEEIFKDQQVKFKVSCMG